MTWSAVLPFAVKAGIAVLAFVLYKTLCKAEMSVGSYDCYAVMSDGHHIKSTLEVTDTGYFVLVKSTRYDAQQNGIIVDDSNVLQYWRLR